MSAAGHRAAAVITWPAVPDVQDDPGELMTRRQVAYLFRATSAAVATWARRGRLIEVRDEAGRPRYRRADVETLARNEFRRRP